MHLKTLAFALGVIAATAPAHAALDKTCGRASWYALTSRTASGERMDPSKMTAAHPSLPFGTRVKVTNQNNGRSVVVRINDRGPFVGSRIIDLSKAAAHHLSFVSRGVTKVCLSTDLDDDQPSRVPMKKPLPSPERS